MGDRARGECYDCSEPALSDRTRCAKHLASSARVSRTYHKTDKGEATGARARPYRAGWHRKHRRGAGRFVYAKGHAKRRGIAWSLTKQEYETLIVQPCAYCRLPNDVEAGVGLDRLDNSRGYEIDNVVSCCVTCNLVRGDRFTPLEMEVIGRAIRKIRMARLSEAVEA